MARRRRYHRLRRRRRNPRMRYHRRRRHNPFGVTRSSVLPVVGGAIVGGVGSRAIPEMVLRDSNTGIFGYAANALTALGIAWIAERWVSPNVAQGALIGGLTMTAGRIIEDNFGKKLVEFSANLSGDPGYALGGYAPLNFVLPSGMGQGSRIALPAPTPIAAGNGGGNHRGASKFAA